MEAVEEVVAEIPFLDGDERWAGKFQIVRRTATRDGRTRTYSNLRIRIGERFLNLPNRNIESVIEAYRKAAGVATEDYEALMKEINARRFGAPGKKTERRPPRRREDDFEGAE